MSLTEALLFLILYLLTVTNGLLFGYIVGRIFGAFAAKLILCVIGVTYTINNSDTGEVESYHFKWKEAWQVQNDYEMLLRQAKLQELYKIEGNFYAP